MADAEDTKKPEQAKKAEDTKQPEQASPGKDDEKASGGGTLQWIIMAVVVVLCAGSGFAIGRLFASSPVHKTTESSQEDEPAQPEYLKSDESATGSQQSWYYDLDPVVANLDEPGVTRYIRTVLTLEISSAIDNKKGTALLEEKKPVLKNWLTVYLAGLTLENVRGDRNLKRIQSQVLDAFNEQLFPDTKPKIRRVLFKEFAVQ
ncbi:MAG: hypothetical protein DRP62_05885 [Planctomycetota bacterium]|nr:MAG: hypothetical protein DRP62_05885 [Planctomycetota bacterium]